MQEKREIRNGKEFRVFVLPEAEPPTYRSHNSRYQLREVGKHESAPPPKPMKAGQIKRDPRAYPPIKEQDGDMSRFHKTKFPFPATVNGKPVIVHQDRIEHLEPDEPPPWWFNYSQPDEETEQAWANWEEEADA